MRGVQLSERYRGVERTLICKQSMRGLEPAVTSAVEAQVVAELPTPLRSRPFRVPTSPLQATVVDPYRFCGRPFPVSESVQRFQA